MTCSMSLRPGGEEEKAVGQSEASQPLQAFGPSKASEAFEVEKPVEQQ
jgi:hypothetical protein